MSDNTYATALGALIEWAGDAADLNDCRDAARHVADALADRERAGRVDELRRAANDLKARASARYWTAASLLLVRADRITDQGDRHE